MAFYAVTAFKLNDPSQIFLTDPNGALFGVLSLIFLLDRNGNLNNGKYVTEVARSIAYFPEDVALFSSPLQRDISETDEIVPGVYQVRCALSEFSLVVGPASKSSFRIGAPSGSTVSHSSRSTQGQKAFRRLLADRDIKCKITGSGLSYSQACHIVPFTAGSVYLSQIVSPYFLDPKYNADYHPQNGMIIARSVHGAFDEYDIGIYLDDSNSWGTVHAFSDDEIMRSFHGRIVHFQNTKIPQPHPHVIRWHYSQCLMKNVRGRDVMMPV